MNRPNILLITCHDLGRHLGCYGWGSVPSPTIDGLAKEGVQLTNSFCTAPQCSPSRAALLTGRHAHSVGVLGLAHSPFNWRLEPEQNPFAQRMQQIGYATALIGAQHVTRYEDLPELGYDHWSGVAPAPEIAHRAADYLTSATETTPFYLEVGFEEPHRPYDWGGATPHNAQGVDLPPYIPNAPPAVADFAALQGAIRVVDRAVGAILERLAVLGLAENTLVIFTTDHGLAMPRAKCTLYDPGIETALLMRWPAAGVSGGRRIQPLISHVDVVPTLLQALDVPLPSRLHGRSFWPLLQGRPFHARDAIFVEKSFHTAYEPMRAMRTDTHKLIVNLESGSRYDVPDDIRRSPIYPLVVDQIAGERSHVELYDLARDPLEQDNLAGYPEVSGVQADLRRRLWQWMEDTDDPLRYGPPRSPYFERSHSWLQSVLDKP